MNTHQAQLRHALQAHTDLSAGALQLALKISQPTLSRALRSLGEDLLVIGRGPRTRYGLRRNVRGLGTQWPIFRIDSNGTPEQLGTLQALHQGAFHFQPTLPCTWQTGEFRDGVFPDLPWFLADLRPQGFLGRLAARQMAPVLLCDPDPRNWSSDLILHSLLAFGDDLSGDLLIGEAALERVRKAHVARVEEVDFPDLAQRALSGELVGSSAAGEQPKFTCWLAKDGVPSAHLLKFSPPMATSTGRRWADLLSAEAHAARLLGVTGVRTVDIGDRRFLVIPRFDRIGAHGRRGLVTLGSVDAAYFGGYDNWDLCAKRLALAGWLSPEDAAVLRLRYFFGRAIGNSDMHFGNASLEFDRTLPLRLAPSYDMLPMQFAPNAAGEIVKRAYAAPALGTDPLQAEAHQLARQFWREVAEDGQISPDFLNVARDCLGALGGT